MVSQPYVAVDIDAWHVPRQFPFIISPSEMKLLLHPAWEQMHRWLQENPGGLREGFTNARDFEWEKEGWDNVNILHSRAEDAVAVLDAMEPSRSRPC